MSGPMFPMIKHIVFRPFERKNNYRRDVLLMSSDVRCRFCHTVGVQVYTLHIYTHTHTRACARVWVYGRVQVYYVYYKPTSKSITRLQSGRLRILINFLENPTCCAVCVRDCEVCFPGEALFVI